MIRVRRGVVGQSAVRDIKRELAREMKDKKTMQD